MFNKIVTGGNVDVAVRKYSIDIYVNLKSIHSPQVPPDPATRPPTRFLSRFDKSATNIKESELFITIGQVCFDVIYFIPT